MTHLASLLLVDDDRHVLDSMSQWLRSKNYRVDTARDCQSAIAQIDAKKYELVICDLRLGTDDGFDVLAHCRANYPGVSVILVTGYGTVETGVEALRAGAFDLLIMMLSLQIQWPRPSHRSLGERTLNIALQ